jgi:large subunit ribosomal protein L9
MMEVILKQDVHGVGYKNDIVKVRPGYGRNYLIPNDLAVIASDSNKRLVNENVRQAAHKAEKIKTEAANLAQRMGELTVEIRTKAGETGRIFGAVTAHQIAEALKAKGFDVDRKKVVLKETPKNVGVYPALLDLHKEVKHEIKVSVVAE